MTLREYCTHVAPIEGRVPLLPWPPPATVATRWVVPLPQDLYLYCEAGRLDVVWLPGDVLAPCLAIHRMPYETCPENLLPHQRIVWQHERAHVLRHGASASAESLAALQTWLTALRGRPPVFDPEDD